MQRRITNARRKRPTVATTDRTTTKPSTTEVSEKAIRQFIEHYPAHIKKHSFIETVLSKIENMPPLTFMNKIHSHMYLSVLHYALGLGYKAQKAYSNAMQHFNQAKLFHATIGGSFDKIHSNSWVSQHYYSKQKTHRRAREFDRVFQHLTIEQIVKEYCDCREGFFRKNPITIKKSQRQDIEKLRSKPDLLFQVAKTFTIAMLGNTGNEEVINCVLPKIIGSHLGTRYIKYTSIIRQLIETSPYTESYYIFKLSANETNRNPFLSLLPDNVGLKRNFDAAFTKKITTDTFQLIMRICLFIIFLLLSSIDYYFDLSMKVGFPFLTPLLWLLAVVSLLWLLIKFLNMHLSNAGQEYSLALHMENHELDLNLGINASLRVEFITNQPKTHPITKGEEECLSETEEPKTCRVIMTFETAETYVPTQRRDKVKTKGEANPAKVKARTFDKPEVSSVQQQLDTHLPGVAEDELHHLENSTRSEMLFIPDRFINDYGIGDRRLTFLAKDGDWNGLKPIHIPGHDGIAQVHIAGQDISIKITHELKLAGTGNDAQRLFCGLIPGTQIYMGLIHLEKGLHKSWKPLETAIKQSNITPIEINLPDRRMELR